MSEKPSAEKITKEQVAENPRAGLRDDSRSRDSEGSNLYQEHRKSFDFLEGELQKGTFEVPSGMDNPPINMGRVARKIDELKHSSNPKDFGAVRKELEVLRGVLKNQDRLELEKPLNEAFVEGAQQLPAESEWAPQISETKPEQENIPAIQEQIPEHQELVPVASYIRPGAPLIPTEMLWNGAQAEMERRREKGESYESILADLATRGKSASAPSVPSAELPKSPAPPTERVSEPPKPPEQIPPQPSVVSKEKSSFADLPETIVHDTDTLREAAAGMFTGTLAENKEKLRQMIPQGDKNAPESADALRNRILTLAVFTRGEGAAMKLAEEYANGPARTSEKFFAESAPHTIRMLEAEKGYFDALRTHNKQKGIGAMLADQFRDAGKHLPPEVKALREEWVKSRADYARYLRASTETRHLNRELKSESTQKRDIDQVLARYQRRFTTREVLLGAEEAEQRVRVEGLRAREKNCMDKAFDWYKKLPAEARVFGTSALLTTAGVAMTGGWYVLVPLSLGVASGLSRWKAEFEKDPETKKRWTAAARVTGIGALFGLAGEYGTRWAHKVFGTEEKAGATLKQKEGFGDLGSAENLGKLSGKRRKAVVVGETIDRQARIARGVAAFGGGIAAGAVAHEVFGGGGVPDAGPPEGSPAGLGGAGVIDNTQGGAGIIGTVPEEGYNPNVPGPESPWVVGHGAESAPVPPADAGGSAEIVPPSDVSPAGVGAGESPVATVPSAEGSPSSLGGAGAETPHLSVEASLGHGYEYMTKRLWEQMHDPAKHFSLPAGTDPNSDLAKLWAADAGSIDKVVHQIAADPSHNFYHADMRNVLIEPHSHLSIGADGNLHFSDSTHPDVIQAPENAPTTPPYHPAAPEVVTTVPMGDPTSVAESLAAHQSESGMAEVPMSTPEVPPIAATEVPAPPAPTMEHNLVTPGTVDPSHAHDYLADGSAKTVFGGSAAERIARATAWATKDHTAEVYFESTDRSFFGRFFGSPPHLAKMQWDPTTGSVHAVEVPSTTVPAAKDLRELLPDNH